MSTRILATLVSVFLPATAAHAAGQASSVPDVLVCLPRAADRARLEAFLAREGGQVLEELPALAILRVELPEARGARAAAARLRPLAGVSFAEPNDWGQGGGFPVDDPLFELAWHLDNRGQFGGRPGADIEAVRGWELARGSPGVRVAVLDSGLALGHPEFAGRILPGHDFVQGDEVPADDHGHGTWVTSILASNADNAFGLAGVDHRCLVMPVKVLNRNNRGSTFALAQGLVFAADAGADVVNMSLIDFPTSATLREALSYARAAGCVLVACAGNGGVGDADRSQPGRSPLVISVGATTWFDSRAGFSGTGAALDVVAPGESVPMMLLEPLDGWGLFSGCSAATPVAAGIVAVALSVAPALTPAEVQALLEGAAEDQVGPPQSDPPGRDDQYGHGRVNLYRTLCALDAGGPAILAPDVLTVEGTSPAGVPGDDPSVAAALATVVANDDLDPEPSLAHGPPPAALALGSLTPIAFTALDRCGNESRREVALAVVDSRPPEVALSLLVQQLEPLDGTLRPVGLAAGASDACDLKPELALHVYGDEPSPRDKADALLDHTGALQLRATCRADGDGRVYLVLVIARDDNGNARQSCATVVVPNGTAPAALEDVLAQARLARDACAATAKPPAGFLLLFSGTLPRPSSPFAR